MYLDFSKWNKDLVELLNDVIIFNKLDFWKQKKYYNEFRIN